MPLPFEYAVRNLGRSPLRLFISVAGSALVVLLMIAAAAFVRGMETSLRDSGSRDNAILLGAGSEESIERSEIKSSVATQAVASIPGIKTHLDVPFVSPEIHMALTVGLTREEVSTAQAVVRGVSPEAFLVHPQVRITAGRAMNQGNDEIIVGKLAATRLGLTQQQLAVGNKLWFDDKEWTIVGRFEAPGTVMDAEIWAPINDIKVTAKRDTISCVVLTLDEGGEYEDVEVFAASRVDLELVALRETDYYHKLVAFYQPVRVMIWITAILIAIGGVFGGLNTMYAAFSARVREIGMLQSLGYSRRAIVWSFMQESTLAAATGALIAAGLSLIVFQNMAVKFSMGAFSLVMDAPTLLIGLGAGLLLGIFGALPPAARCLKMPITTALKAA
ncbi:MAG: FtsX-like permease family protein [Phycisphaeraceae bacterium]